MNGAILTTEMGGIIRYSLTAGIIRYLSSAGLQSDPTASSEMAIATTTGRTPEKKSLDKLHGRNGPQEENRRNC